MNRELVALLDNRADAELTALRSAGFQVLQETPLPALQTRALLLRTPLGLREEEALSLAESLAPSAVIDANTLYQPSGVGCDGACWGAELVALRETPQEACGAAPIAMIDTAIDLSHPTLRDAKISTRSFVTEEAARQAEHGTAIAALLVGESAPGARPLVPGAQLLAAEVFEDRSGALISDTFVVLQGLNWSLSQQAGVIAMSLEGPPNTALGLAVRRSAERANLVAAAGNGGAGGRPAYPAAYPEVIAVSAVDERLRPYRKGTRGAYIEIAAPGVDIVSAGSAGGRKAWSGTSVAVPFVAAALMRARFATDGSPDAARQLLQTKALDLGPAGRDDLFGFGLLQVPAAGCR
ncbi:MAG: S8 family serine peptidase [Pseudomonadota bacterium]